MSTFYLHLLKLCNRYCKNIWLRLCRFPVPIRKGRVAKVLRVRLEPVASWVRMEAGVKMEARVSYLLAASTSAL